jgi:alpha-glucosidase
MSLNITYTDAHLRPHHDGSELYVSSDAPKLGSEVTLRVRIPNTYTFDIGLVRYYMDSESTVAQLSKESDGEVESWWSAKIPIKNYDVQYRFLFSRAGKYEWLNASGLFAHDVHTNEDFRIIARPRTTTWLKSSVFYQIFPDRFAKGVERPAPEWALPMQWDALPHGHGPTTGIELFGGDFEGITAHLDHIIDLGANGIYFTPFFPSKSNHRYDATSFDQVDPLLGGDKAFFEFMKAAKKAKIKVLGDITTNHCSNEHPWFLTGKKSKSSKENKFFYWDKKTPFGYATFYAVKQMPKLNFASPELRKRFYQAKNSVIQKWLSPKYGLDGWRIDVGNQTGRYREADMHDEVMRDIRTSMDSMKPNTWLVAENADMWPTDLNGTGWDGTMNYNGFMRPLWAWFNHEPQLESGGFHGLPIAIPKTTGAQFVKAMTVFNSSIPWRNLIDSMTLLDSHDTARMRNVVGGDTAKHLAAMGLLLTYPGVPSIYAGDEIGLEGAWGEDGRRTMTWNDAHNWDHNFLNSVKELVKLRRTSPALIEGGLRWIDVQDDHLLFLREATDQNLLILVARDKTKVDVDLSKYGYSIIGTHFGPTASSSRLKLKTRNGVAGIWEVA